jgi:hypothetical protein
LAPAACWYWRASVATVTSAAASPAAERRPAEAVRSIPVAEARRRPADGRPQRR